MTREETIEAYTKKFGGFPYFLMMGASDETLVREVEKALESGEEIEPEEGAVY
jgi:hypothetical protein